MATKKRTKNVTKSGKSTQYWDTVDEILKISENYTKRKKLRVNLLDPSTAFKVQHVLDNYYGGKMSNLVDAIATDAESFYAKVEKINICLLSKGLITIRDSDKLLELLIDNDRRNFYRKKVDEEREADMIIPLQILEANYRGRK